MNLQFLGYLLDVDIIQQPGI